SGTLDDQLTRCGEGERRRRAHGRLDEGDANRECTLLQRGVHASSPSGASRSLPRRPAPVTTLTRESTTRPRMIAASAIATTTDGTPASRCIAVAPASSAPNSI